MPPGPGTLRATVDLPPVARSAAAARRLVAQMLEAWAAESFREDATLLVSELVTNVVRHVAGHVALRVEVALTYAALPGSALAEPGLRVAVVDSSTVPPVVGPRGPEGGYGLGLVVALADRWGSEEHGGGKRVWFELGRRAG
jgi:anti-sigma regulatory factor (Ser/Thr protein kinase)